MSKRGALITDFLAETTWANWDQNPLAGDASARRYTRLTHKAQSVILMDAPSENGEDTGAFAQIASYLTDHGLCPPDILKHDPDNGLMVISDLGPHDFANWLRTHPQDTTALYKAAADVLTKLHRQKPDFPLNRLTPEIGGDMIALLNPYYSDHPVTELVNTMTAAMRELAPEPDTIALRDFHAENLIWRCDQRGDAQVGLLDFQDALIAPAGYDLVSLLRDVRRDVPESLNSEIITNFIETTGLGHDFRAQLACLGAQRNLRILGVFARLAKTRKKPRYIDLLPRVWNNLLRDLGHPALADLRQAALAALPEPDATHMLKLRQ